MNTEERLEKLEQELGRAKRRTRAMLAGFALVAAVVGLWAVGTGTPTAEAQQAGNPQDRGDTELRSSILAEIGDGQQYVSGLGSKLVKMARQGDLAAAQLLLAYIDGRPVELVRLPGTDSESN
jgi:hypothetical protein